MPNDSQNPSGESADVSFGDILKEFENTGREKKQGGRGKRRSAASSSLRGTVVGVSGDWVLVDYGMKSEGVIPKADLLDADGNLTVQRGDTFDVAITGWNSEGMVTLSRVKGPRPRDWDGLMRAFEKKEIIAGRVTGAVKGGFTVDVGTRAFLPASRSGTRTPEEMQQLVGRRFVAASPKSTWMTRMSSSTGARSWKKKRSRPGTTCSRVWKREPSFAARFNHSPTTGRSWTSAVASMAFCTLAIFPGRVSQIPQPNWLSAMCWNSKSSRPTSKPEKFRSVSSRCSRIPGTRRPRH